jgi:hypothetical protein
MPRFQSRFPRQESHSARRLLQQPTSICRIRCFEVRLDIFRKCISLLFYWISSIFFHCLALCVDLTYEDDELSVEAPELVSFTNVDKSIRIKMRAFALPSALRDYLYQERAGLAGILDDATSHSSFDKLCQDSQSFLQHLDQLARGESFNMETKR